MRALQIVLVSLGLGLGAAPAAAQESTPTEPSAELTAEQRDAARAHFEAGTLAYERGDYAAAEEEFTAAYEATRHADLLYNLYTAQERGGRVEAAAASLESYLRDGAVDDARREALTVRLDRLRARIESERATARAAEQAAARERAEAEARVDAAQSSASSERASRMAAVREGHATSDALLLTGITVSIAAAAGLGVFGGLAGASLAEDQAVAARCGRDAGMVCRSDDVEQLESLNLAADVTWIVSAGLGALGLTLVLVGEALRPGERADVAFVRPVIGPGVVGAVVAGSF